MTEISIGFWIWFIFGFLFIGKLFCVFGMVFIFLGFQLLSEQNSAWILFSVFGVMFESIIAMVIYTTVIEKKYNKENRKYEKGENL